MWWWWIINIYFELFDIKINTALATAHTTSTAHIALGNLTPFDGDMPPHFDLQLTNSLYTFINTEIVMSFWLSFRHYLHRKLSKCQFLVKRVMEILTKWRHCRRRSGGGRTTCIGVIAATRTSTPGNSTGTYQLSRAVKSTGFAVSTLTLVITGGYILLYGRHRRESIETGAA